MIDETVRSGITFALMVLGLVVIFAPLLAERLRLPGLLGLLIAGALIGPNVFGVLDDFSTLERIGQVGILYLVFLAGLELDRETFNRFRSMSINFGLITSAVSMVLGVAVCLSLGFDTRASILIGSFWASFTLIAYPVIDQYDLSKNRAGAAVIGASAVTDAVSLLILAVIAGLETGERSGFALVVSILVGLAVLALWCLIALPAIAKWFFASMGRGRILRFTLVFVGLMSAAVLSEIVGVEPLLGAFFAGLGLNRAIPNESLLMEHVAFVGNSLFIPVFLVSVGLLFDPEVMFVPSTLWLALWLSIALVAGKAIAAWLTGRLYKLTDPEWKLLFTVSVAQAAATLAGTVIGFELGLYGQDVVNAVMVVIAVSLVVTSTGTPKVAAKIGKPVEDEQRLGERVLLAVRDAGGHLANRLRVAGGIAAANDGLVLPVVVSMPESDGNLAELRARVTAVDAELHALGLEGETRLRVDRSLAEGIANAAVENGATFVILGWAGQQPLAGLFTESIASEVAGLVKCPVAVVAAAAGEPERALLVITERDLRTESADEARAALKLAIALAPERRLVVGPVEPGRLTGLGVEIPDWVRHAPGVGDVIAWTESLSDPGDLLVAVSHGLPTERTARAILGGGRTVITVTPSSQSRWISRDPALHVPNLPP